MKLLLLTILVLSWDTAHATDFMQVRPARINVRAAPGVSSKILTKLNRGKVVRKIGQRGDWTKVHVGTNVSVAWIYSPLLEPLSDPFLKFQKEYNRINELSRSVGGRALLKEARPRGGGVIYIETTTAWASITPGQQTFYLESLYRSWKKANNGNSVTLHLYDGKTHHLQSDLPR